MFGILGFILMDFPTGGVLYQGPAKECRLDDESHRALSNCIAEILFEMRMRPQSDVSGFTISAEADGQQQHTHNQWRNVSSRSRFDLVIEALDRNCYSKTIPVPISTSRTPELPQIYPVLPAISRLKNSSSHHRRGKVRDRATSDSSKGYRNFRSQGSVHLGTMSGTSSTGHDNPSPGPEYGPRALTYPHVASSDPAIVHARVRSASHSGMPSQYERDSSSSVSSLTSSPMEDPQMMAISELLCRNKAQRKFKPFMAGKDSEEDRTDKEFSLDGYSTDDVDTENETLSERLLQSASMPASIWATSDDVESQRSHHASRSAPNFSARDTATATTGRVGFYKQQGFISTLTPPRQSSLRSSVMSNPTALSRQNRPVLTNTPRPQLKSAIQACARAIRTDTWTQSARIDHTSSSEPWTVNRHDPVIASRRASLEGQVRAEQESFIRNSESWFDQDATVYCSYHAHVVSGDGGEIVRLVYYPGARASTATTRISFAPFSTSASSMNSKGILQKLSIRDTGGTNERPFHWMTENCISWPTDFVRAINPSGVHDTVAAYEQAQLMNALVALGRLDSHPRSKCRFPRDLLALLPRVLCIAHDELVFMGSKLDTIKARRYLRPDLPRPRSTGLFSEIQTVFTHRNLEPTSLVINRQQGNVVSMINFQHAGFLPSYVENIQEPFIEKTNSSFWNVHRPKSTTDSGTSSKEETKNHSKKRISSSSSKASTSSRFLSFRGNFAHSQQPPDAPPTGPSIVLSPGAAPKLSQESSSLSPWFTRRCSHPTPYPIINHYLARGASGACKAMAYTETPASHSTPGSTDTRALGNETKGVFADTGIRRVKSSTKTRKSLTRSLKKLLRPKSYQEKGMRSGIGCLTGGFNFSTTFVAHKNTAVPPPSHNITTNSSATSVYSLSPLDNGNGGGPRVVPFLPSFLHSPSDTQGGTLVPRIPKVNQVGWSQFIESYRHLEDSSSVAGKGSIFGLSNERLPSSPNPRGSVGQTVKDSQIFEHGQEAKALAALVSLSKTLQNLVVVLESGGVVLTPEQLLNAVALKKQEWERERRVRAEAEISQLQVANQSTVASEQSTQQYDGPQTATTVATNNSNTNSNAITSIDTDKQPTTSRRATRQTIFRTMLQKITKKPSPKPAQQPVVHSYRPIRTSADNILYSAPGQQRDPLPSELPEHLLMNYNNINIAGDNNNNNSSSNNDNASSCSSDDSNDSKSTDHPNDEESPKSPTPSAALRLTSPIRGREDTILPLDPDARLGSITAPHLPAYGIQLSNPDRTKNLAQVEMERVEGEEREFWKEFEGLCESLDDNINSNNNTYNYGSKNASSYYSGFESIRDDVKGKAKAMEGDRRSRDSRQSRESKERRDRFPGVALFHLEDFTYNLEVVEKYVSKLEAQAAKHYKVWEKRHKPSDAPGYI
ncbi:hypothetical protein BGZ58_005945 [Dissophora ornata]|nr:hypothetical protein BGZ58_005945 [Dissophora ornata]